MKAAISVPDAVFEEVDRYARGAKKSRSQVYSEAASEYLARHAPDAVTAAMNDACAKVDVAKDEFVRLAALRVLGRDEW